MRLKDLETALQPLKRFEKANVQLEQVSTDDSPRTAAPK